MHFPYSFSLSDKMCPQVTTLLISNVPKYLTPGISLPCSVQLVASFHLKLLAGALLSMFEELQKPFYALPFLSLNTKREDLTSTMRGRFDFFYCPWIEKAVSHGSRVHSVGRPQRWLCSDQFSSHLEGNESFKRGP